MAKNSKNPGPKARVARAKSQGRSPYPRCAITGKHVNKQGFGNTAKFKKG